MNVIDEAVEAVIGMMNAQSPFATVTRGALPTGNGIVCEVTTSVNAETFLDKGARIPIDLTVNAKHKNLKTLSNTMNDIHENLTKIRTSGGYPSSTGWKIIDIWTGNYPMIVTREDNNTWVMASSLIVNLEKKGV